MKYLNILLAFAGETWAMDRTKLDQIVAFLITKSDGVMFSPEEIEARTNNRRDREIAKAPGAVGVVPIHGMLVPRASRLQASETGTSLDAVAQGFRAMLADDSVKAIVFDHDSPGGLTDGVDELAQEIFDARGVKPIIAQVNSLAASASYYLASQADEIYVTPSGSLGSIGVYSVHEDISKHLEMRGIKRTVIRSSAHKAEGNPHEPLTEDAREHFRERVMAANEMFVKAVARGRGVTKSVVNDKFGQGRTYHAAEAVKRGMADRVQPMRETLSRFGVEVSPARKSASTQARAQLALGRVPAIGDFEALLREAGAPKDLATALASGGLGKMGRGDPGSKERSESAPEPGQSAVSKDTLAALMRALK